MRISPVAYFNTCRPIVPSFKSNELETLNENGEVVNRNVTELFRADLRWQEFTELLAEKYYNTDRINIVDYACSDGSEAYTLALSLMNYAPEICEKSFPIIAKDFDKHILRQAIAGPCNVFNSDIDAINDHTNNRFDDYFNIVPAQDSDFIFAIRPKKILKDKILFEHANILEDVQRLPDENNIILCRNCWEYLGKQNFHYLAEQLYEKTKNNGLLVIGKHEEKFGVPEVLKKHGFRETQVKHVYEPVKRMTA